MRKNRNRFIGEATVIMIIAAWAANASATAFTLTNTNAAAGSVRQAVSNANAAGGQTDIAGPVGSGQFGAAVAVLPNGNIVVTDPSFSLPGPIAGVGAVYLFNGSTLAEISRLTGSVAGDAVGSGGITVLTNGNYVVSSTNCDNSAVNAAGAVTLGNANTGVTGTVSAANSLVGSTANDTVGSSALTALTNGNYVVRSPNWDAPGAANAGAATFGNGNTGVTGTVSAANSLVGSTASDSTSLTIIPLTNGNYVVRNPNWDGPGAANAGAVTFGNGTTGTSGTISAANSLVGSTADDTLAGVAVGSGVTALTNGNYVVSSVRWDAPGVVDAGAITFGNGTTGISGPISAANSLIGSTASDRLGSSPSDGVFALTNGNYVVVSQFYNAPGAALAGAATFGNGTTGIMGTVSAANSLVGSAANHNVGSSGVTALTNGNYVVSSRQWDAAGVLQAGAATFGNGTTGISGTISAANSLVGSTASDQVGLNGVTALTNGNYVVASEVWAAPGASAAGAVTFGNGNTGVTGTVSAANSLVGSTSQDRVGNGGVTALTNGNYVVATPEWDAPGTVNVGAVTLGNGTTGTTGTVSAANSLVGSTAADFVGSNSGGNSSVVALTNGNYIVASVSWDAPGVAGAGAVTFGNGIKGVTGAVSAANSLVGSTASDSLNFTIHGLTNGNYVVHNPNWDAPGAANAGAVTFGNGTTGTSGAVSASNSLVGSAAGDQVGSGGITPLTNGSYVAHSNFWDNGAVLNTGAVTYGIGTGGTTGPINSGNSVMGTVGGTLNFSPTLSHGRLVVGRPNSNIVTIFNFDSATSRTKFDYDGDGKSDVSVFRPSTNEWHIMQSGGGIRVQGWGLANDKPVPADFDGDGKTDLAVFRPGEGNWYVLNSANNTVTVAGWGLLGDLPVPADYNGDNKADLVVYRPSNRHWYRRDSDGLIHVFEWGLADDRPAPADFTGDGRTDLAVFRPGNGTWYVLSSSDYSVTTRGWGLNGDTPVPGDYDGDAKADFCVFRPSDNNWYRVNSSDNTIHVITWGLTGDKLTPGDFDGDGKTDLAVYRPSNGTWYVFGSQAGIYSQPFGLAADLPTPNAFLY